MNISPARQLPAKLLLALLFLATFPSIIQAQKKYWQQQVNFIIDVTLDDVEHTLDGVEKIDYTNNAPDTLYFLWFHLWPNAFKNDQTAFSEQLLLNGRTDFYFSGKEQRGYINRLDFKVNGNTARVEDHPQYIDIVKLLLPEPLAPGQQIHITTPFHVKLPDNFSGGGHVKQSYQVTSWYPQPAVYDHEGWHPMPYLDQGGSYGEFGNYEVRITVPGNYVVAATGELQDPEEIKWLKTRQNGSSLRTKFNSTSNPPRSLSNNAKPTDESPKSFAAPKSLRFLQTNVHGFAWFADKRLIAESDTIILESGKIINAYSYYLPEHAAAWKNSIRVMKAAIHKTTGLLGDYPYNNVSAVEISAGPYGSIQFPTIAGISSSDSEQELEGVLTHELKNNWFNAALSTNTRRYPWMGEGINNYYDASFSTLNEPSPQKNFDVFQSKRLPKISDQLFFEILSGEKRDQQINTASEKFNAINYRLALSYKTLVWMKQLELTLGKQIFDSCMREYYSIWKFKHPYPEDFKRVIESVSLKNMDSVFSLLDSKGSFFSPVEKKLTLSTFYSLKETQQTNYIGIAPVPAFNLYDGLMLGAIIHNYQLPLKPFSFFVLPLYATNSRKIAGLARLSYTWYPNSRGDQLAVGSSFSKFSKNEFQPEGKEKLYPGFVKLAPFIRVTFGNPDALKQTQRYLQLKSILISEDELDFRQVINGADTGNIVSLNTRHQTINQLKMVIRNPRVLYPYSGELMLEQNKKFYRASFTGNYYFNYSNRQGGLDARLFAGKFIYNGAQTDDKKFETDRYHLNLSAPNGYEDYTYSDYFVGRNKFENWGSQQIMIRDGGFKVRTELLSDKIGKTDDWLIAANFTTDFPKGLNPFEVLPFKIPVKLFADLGTFAEPWKDDATTNRFLFDAGIQVSLFRQTLNIYIPVIYSRVFKDYFRSTLGDNRFWKTISFSIDVKHFNMKKIYRAFPS